MDTKINYTLVGFIVVTLVAFFAAFLLWWTTGLNRQVYNTYLVYMDQDVAGLTNQALVRYSGVTVGNVTKIELNPDNPQQVILFLRIKQHTPVTTSTIATLASQGITGATYVSLSATTPDAPLLVAQAGQKYPIIPAQPSLMSQVLSLMKSAATNFNDISISVKSMFDTENTKNFKEILKNLSSASKEMPQMVASVQQSAQQVSTLANNVNQAMPSALDLLNQLNQVSGNLTDITGQMKQNPAVLLRGSTGETLGPGEQ